MNQPWQRLSVILIILLVLFTPALILVATLEALFLLGEITLSEISAVEFAELYVLDLALLLLFAVTIYQIAKYVLGRPPSLSRADSGSAERSADDDRPQ